MDAIATIGISLFAIGLSALTAWRLAREPKRPPMSIYGDFPAVPEGLRGAAKASPGGGADKANPALVRTQEAIARSHGGASK